MRIFFLGALALFLPVCGVRADLIDGIYVIVNDSIITYQEVESAIAPLSRLLANQYQNQPEVLDQKLQQTRKEKLDELIERQLILQEFKSGPYQLPESVIDDIIRERTKERFGDRATLTKTLQAEGMTFETYRKEVREDYVIRAMTSEKLSSEKVIISPHKIESYYNEHQDTFKMGDQVKLRMIVLNKTKEDPEAAKKLAEEISSKLKEGASFADMASIYSDSQKDKGGDRGWIDRNYLKKELADAAFSLKPGEHSEIIDLVGENGQPGAYYLLFVEDVKSTHTRPLADVRDEIEKILRNQEQARLKDRWIERLKTKAFIRYY